MDFKVPCLLLAVIDKRFLSVSGDDIEAAVEIEVDFLLPIPFGVAENMGDGCPVGMTMLLSVGRDYETVTLDDVQQLVAGVVHASVVRHFDEIDLQRIVL